VKGMKIVVRKRVGDHGNLFGSVTTNDIADALTAKGIEVDKRRIELAHPIKSIGTHRRRGAPAPRSGRAYSGRSRPGGERIDHRRSAGQGCGGTGG